MLTPGAEGSERLSTDRSVRYNWPAVRNLVGKEEAEMRRVPLVLFTIIALSFTIKGEAQANPGRQLIDNAAPVLKGAAKAAEAGGPTGLKQSLKEISDVKAKFPDEFAAAAQDPNIVRPSQTVIRSNQSAVILDNWPAERISWIHNLYGLATRSDNLSKSFVPPLPEDNILFELILDTNTVLGIRRSLVELYNDGDSQEQVMIQALCLGVDHLVGKVEKENDKIRIHKSEWETLYETAEKTLGALPPEVKRITPTQFFNKANTHFKLEEISPQAAPYYVRACAMKPVR